MKEEKSNCGHCCYNCGFYSPYYTKGYLKFDKAEEGRCRAKRTTVDRHDTCERWMSVKYRIKHYSPDAAKKALLQILSQLSEIRQIIEEAQADE